MEPGWGGVFGAGINVRHQSQKQSTFMLHGRVVVVVVDFDTIIFIVEHLCNIWKI